MSRDGAGPWKPEGGSPRPRTPPFLPSSFSATAGPAPLPRVRKKPQPFPLPGSPPAFHLRTVELSGCHLQRSPKGDPPHPGRALHKHAQRTAARTCLPVLQTRARPRARDRSLPPARSSRQPSAQPAPGGNRQPAAGQMPAGALNPELATRAGAPGTPRSGSDALVPPRGAGSAPERRTAPGSGEEGEPRRGRGQTPGRPGMGTDAGGRSRGSAPPQQPGLGLGAAGPQRSLTWCRDAAARRAGGAGAAARPARPWPPAARRWTGAAPKSGRSRTLAKLLPRRPRRRHRRAGAGGRAARARGRRSAEPGAAPPGSRPPPHLPPRPPRAAARRSLPPPAARAAPSGSSRPAWPSPFPRARWGGRGLALRIRPCCPCGPRTSVCASAWEATQAHDRRERSTPLPGQAPADRRTSRTESSSLPWPVELTAPRGDLLPAAQEGTSVPAPLPSTGTDPQEQFLPKYTQPSNAARQQFCPPSTEGMGEKKRGGHCRCFALVLWSEPCPGH